MLSRFLTGLQAKTCAEELSYGPCHVVPHESPGSWIKKAFVLDTVRMFEELTSSEKSRSTLRHARGKTLVKLTNVALAEGREGVKWELGFGFLRGWEMGLCALGLGFMKKKQ